MVLNINESTVTEKNLMNPRSPQTFFNESGGTGRSRSTLRLRSYQLDWWTKCTQLVYITVLLERSIHTNVDKFVWIIVLTILLCSRPILSCFPNIQPIALLFTTWSYSLGARGRFKAEPCNRCWFFFYDSIWLRTPLETHFHLLDVGQPWATFSTRSQRSKKDNF